MANQEHVEILRQGVEGWNKWREEHRGITPDLRGVNLRDVNLISANLRDANLVRADLRNANLRDANLVRANLIGANLIGANLIGANLSDTFLNSANLICTDLRNTDLSGANLSRADLSGANLSRADLNEASLIKTNLTNVNLTRCFIFGISAWGVNLEGAVQEDLVITDSYEPEITVDNLEVAQFIYLLLNNAKIRDVINTITSKVVLILGRFTDERKPVLDALRDELRNHNCSPVVFDFKKPSSRNFTETISTLAHLSRFVIADLTDAKSIPQELERIIPHLPSVPIKPIIQKDDTEFAMSEDYGWYPWVLPIYRYQDIPSLLASIKEQIIQPVEQKEYEQDEKIALEEENRKLKERIKKLEGGK